jgi:hypothetical protein
MYKTKALLRSQFDGAPGWRHHSAARSDAARRAEAGCKIIGERLKGSGMRWVKHGAATMGICVLST